MARPGFKPLTIRPSGVSDAIDGTNAFHGAMAAMTNLIPSSHTANVWVPRPASIELTTFSGFTSPGQIEALLTVGTMAYGMVATGRFAGHSEPFAYNLSTSSFLSISGVLSSNTPSQAPVSGNAWEPPTIDVVGSRVVFTHPGFALTGNYIGWLDISGFQSTTITGTTNGTVTLSSLSANVLQAGWAAGMTISGSAGDIPAGTTIVSIAANGLSVVMSAAATGSNAGETLTVKGGTTANPQWGAGTTNGVPLVSRPVAVKQFNGRAFYAVANGRQFSDPGVPTQITNATQALTNLNGLPDTAFGGLPVYQSTGGVLQALIAFQGSNGMKMITGDAATSNLAVNDVGVGVGTVAPLTIAQTPRGLAFMAPDGLRLIDAMGNVTEPIGANGEGVNFPFVESSIPSRMCAAFNGGVYRVSVQNGASPNNSWQEYWYDFPRKRWSGPHSFPAALIQPLKGTTGSSFILAAQGIGGALWSSNVSQGAADAYVENGIAMTWSYQTVLLPDTGDDANNVLTDATLACALGPSQTISITANDEFGNVLQNPSLGGSGQAITLWDRTTWGGGLWSASRLLLVQRPIYWTAPLVFKQMSVTITGQSYPGMALGNIYTSFKTLGYHTQQQG